MSHEHANSNSRRVTIALTLTGTFMLVEVAGGVISGSLALLADAGHMLTDTMALGLTAFAFHASARPPDAMRSYGYHRWQILAAFINGIALVLLTIWILVEAIKRILQPPEIMGGMMLLVAGTGLLVNVIVYLILHGGDQENLNMRGAALHVLGDLLGSVGAIVAALVILQTGWTPIDPILSIFVAALILNSAWRLVRRSSNILLEGAPEWLDIAEMERQLLDAVPAIDSIHHVHVWGLTPQHLMLTMHVAVKEEPVDATAIVRDLKKVLHDEFSISHSTIEVEKDDCSEDDNSGEIGK